MNIDFIFFHPPRENTGKGKKSGINFQRYFCNQLSFALRQNVSSTYVVDHYYIIKIKIKSLININNWKTYINKKM